MIVAMLYMHLDPGGGLHLAGLTQWPLILDLIQGILSDRSHGQFGPIPETLWSRGPVRNVIMLS